MFEAIRNAKHFLQSRALPPYSPHPNDPMRNGKYTKLQNGATNNIAFISALRIVGESFA
jgi:hypothetical protein